MRATYTCWRTDILRILTNLEKNGKARLTQKIMSSQCSKEYSYDKRPMLSNNYGAFTSKKTQVRTDLKKTIKLRALYYSGRLSHNKGIVELLNPAQIQARQRQALQDRLCKIGNEKRRSQLSVDDCSERHGAVSAWRDPGVARGWRLHSAAKGWTRMVLRVAL